MGEGGNKNMNCDLSRVQFSIIKSENTSQDKRGNIYALKNVYVQ